MSVSADGLKRERIWRWKKAKAECPGEVCVGDKVHIS
jgi:hypothetical protein